jgi:hypothetical protein
MNQVSGALCGTALLVPVPTVTKPHNHWFIMSENVSYTKRIYANDYWIKKTRGREKEGNVKESGRQIKDNKKNCTV